jgi:hypothetical protein
MTHPTTAGPAATPVPDDALIDAAELRRLCGNISGMTCRRWVEKGILPAPRHIERRRFWRRGEVLSALASHQEPAPASPRPAGPTARRAAAAGARP